MATALTQQLRQLAVASGQPAGGKRLRGKPSLIWSNQEAADVDVETVYGVGQEGERPWRWGTRPSCQRLRTWCREGAMHSARG